MFKEFNLEKLTDSKVLLEKLLEQSKNEILLDYLPNTISNNKNIVVLSPKQKNTKVNDKYLALLAACKQNNGEQVFALLVPWYNSTVDKKISTISEVLQHTQHETLTAAINELQQCFYSKNKQNWQGSHLIKAITLVNKYQDTDKHSTFAINP